ncbi:MAG TPA: GxxExxY protein [Chloroflexia bacterium]|nr:GxxExxY protein [Chloroflexia bacterium]
MSVVEIVGKDEVYAIVGAAIAVHRELGAGFLEAVYHEALEIELRDRSIPFISQQTLAIRYKGHQLKKEYIADLICYDNIIVELKALDQLAGKEEAQVLNYLKATSFRVGLLVNFGSPHKLEWKRFVH